MRAARFEYHRPQSLEEALSLMASLGNGARVLAGGQSLIPMMNLRLARPRHLVDINKVGGLSSVIEEPGRLRVGAIVRYHVLEESALVLAQCPLLSAAASMIGDRQIRSRGTIGGSVAHADPAAELPAALLALGAEVVATRQGAARTIPIESLFVTYLTTSLASEEILAEVRVPVLGRGSRWGFSELRFKPAGFAVGACAVVAHDDEDGICRAVRIALAGAGATPMRVPSAERLLLGQRWSQQAIVAAAETVSRAVEPDGDIHAPGRYRKDAAGWCARRALAQAAGGEVV